MMVSPTDVRRTTIEMLYRARASHLGPSMSVIDILCAVYGLVDLPRIRASAAGRDRVFLSKGHAAAGLYATLWHFDLLDIDPRQHYCRDGSVLAGHASHAVQGVEHSTGALGHGLPVAAGCAYGLRSKGFNDARVYVVVGDGELQEGSNWEGLMFARHHNLSNLTVIVDANGISSIRPTREVIDLEPMGRVFAGLGFAVEEVKGDYAAIDTALRKLHALSQPSVLIARTTKGQGIPFAENQPIWHYRSLDDTLFAEALAALDRATKDAVPEEIIP
ncbi:MAG TPA: transketolase [Bryobacteraceae bacterium]|nr:transketolase [Bryobacteraceae bacterium]